MYFKRNTGYDPLVSIREAEDYRPGIGTVFYHGLRESFDTSSIGLVQSLNRNFMARSRGNVLTESDWRSSKYYRPGLEYEEDMTDELAKVLAMRYDKTKQNEIVFEKTGALGAAAYFGSALLGALPDPINLVPFMALAKKTRPLRTRMTKNALGRVGVGAIEGGAGALALQPLLAADRLSHQERYDIKMAATDVLVGIGAGGLLTGAMEGGRMALKKYTTNPTTGQQTPIEEPRVARNLDRFSIESLTNFARRAFLQVDNNRPVDIAGIEDPGPVNRPNTPEPLTINGLNRLRTDIGNIEAKFEIVELDDLIASNVDGGDKLSVNSQYLAELQPRDRDTAESLTQIQEMSDPSRFDERELVWPSTTGKGGAPVIGPDNMVESGNGRVLVLGRIYDQKGPRLARYKDELKQWAPRYGIDADSIDGMKRPVMIRRRITELDPEDRITFTQRSNTDEVARMQPDEVALSDASLMDESILRFLNDADLDDDINLQFVNTIFNALPAAERKGLTTNGKINEDGIERLENALLAKAYHSPEHPEFLKSMITLKGDDFKQISNALKSTARRWVYMKAKMKAGVFINQDPTSHLIEAIHEFKDLKRALKRKAAEKFTEGPNKGKTKGFRYVLQEHVNNLRDQHNLDPDFGTHANTVLFLDFLSVADSQDKIEAGLRSFIDEVQAYPVDQPGFFEQPSMEAILDRTIGAHRTDLKVDVQRTQTPERPPETIREEVTENQIYAQDEEIDYSVREEEDYIEDIPERGPSDEELRALEEEVDRTIAEEGMLTPRELEEIRNLETTARYEESIGDALDEESPMMRCILSKL